MDDDEHRKVDGTDLEELMKEGDGRTPLGSEGRSPGIQEKRGGGGAKKHEPNRRTRYAPDFGLPF